MLDAPDASGKVAAYQKYAIHDETTVAKIPASISFEDATVIPLAMSSASEGLFSPFACGLKLPSADKPTSTTNEIVLIWGSASSLGANA